MKYALLGLGLLLTAFYAQAQKKMATPPFPYKNPKLPVETRIQDLLGRMTLEEKVAQTYSVWLDKDKVYQTNYQFDEAKAEKGLLKLGIGHIARASETSISGSRGPAENAKIANDIQRFLTTKTRLGIPAIIHEESLHGQQAKDATHFPSHLAMSSSWNEALFAELYSAVAKEVRSRGGHHVLAPVVDIARDPRWGRTEETLGEDPLLTGRLATASVKAYQGQGPTIGKENVAATLKHFGIHGAPEGGVNIAPAYMDERSAREQLLFPFEYVVKKAAPWGVMPTYNEWNGVPAHANKRMLTGMLRNDWGFKGLVLSDYFAVKEVGSIHKISTDSVHIAKLAFEAGVDIELPDPAMFPKLVGLVKSGQVSQAKLDTVVANLLRLKFLLGLFEDPYVDPATADKTVGNDVHRAIARKAAQQSMVLLKNENQTLPLNANDLKKVAVIGPNANRCILGGYSNMPKQLVTPLDGIKAKLQGKAEVIYSEGCRINDSGNWFNDPVKLTDKVLNEKLIAEAVEVAKQADIVILCVGGNEATSREGWGKDHLGDLTTLDLLGQQNDLVKALAGTGKTLVSCIFSGPPLSTPYLNSQSKALLQCWYLGQETGHALADVLFGDVSPSGKLTISVPRSVGHIPAYYNHKPSSRRGYHLDSITPLFPFGYGLSYTTFAYGKPALERSKMSSKETNKIVVEVTNTGKRTGDEIVQLYIRDKESSFTRPVKELKDFKRISLKPGETRKVEFNVQAEMLQMLDANLKYVVEPGDFDIMVGPSSVQLQTVTLTVE